MMTDDAILSGKMQLYPCSSPISSGLYNFQIWKIDTRFVICISNDSFTVPIQSHLWYTKLVFYSCSKLELLTGRHKNILLHNTFSIDFITANEQNELYLTSRVIHVYQF